MKSPKTKKTASAHTYAQSRGSHFASRPFGAAQDHEQAAQRGNRTGLPDRLKAGIEHLSGVSLNDVNVHFNSPKPAGLDALAYTQGSSIHVGPGQEKHLPHEAWHVVQQKQGRVRPSTQVYGMPINADAHLENEAERQGANAIHNKKINLGKFAHSHRQNSPVIQLNGKKKKGKYASKKDAASREAAREAKFSSKTAGGTRVFNNNEGRLPKAPKGQHYMETDVGAGRSDRGKRRIVSLVEDKTGRVHKQYNTDDHYRTFK